MTVVSVRLFRTFALFRTRRFKNGSRAFLQAPLHPGGDVLLIAAALDHAAKAIVRLGLPLDGEYPRPNADEEPSA